MPPDPVVNEALAADVLRRIADLRERLREWIDPDSYAFDAVLADPMRAYLAGEADPVGAAATLVSLSDGDVWREYHGGAGPRARMRYDGLADAWTAEHGLAFAMNAFVELSGIGPSVDRWVGEGTTRGVKASFEFSMSQLWESRLGGVRRMRELMTAADEPVLERLGALRTTPLRRIVASYLVPDREDWLDECFAAPPAYGAERDANWMLWCCLKTAAQFERARGGLCGGRYEMVPDVLATAFAGAGPALVPVLSAALDGDLLAPNRDTILTLLARLPSDEAFSALVERADRTPVRRALDAAAKRFPERAERFTSSGSGMADRPVPEAAQDALPPLLVSPPWTRADAPGVAGLKPPSERAIVWEAGEREQWAAKRHFSLESLSRHAPEEALANAIEAVRDGTVKNLVQEVCVFMYAPDDVVDELLPGWTPTTYRFAPGWIPGFIARFELGAREVALQFARHPEKDDARQAREALLPFRDAEIAEQMAGWLARGPEPLDPVRDWFGRHGTEAVPLLVPLALGRPGARRRQAEHALRFIAERTGADRVVAAAGEHGDAVERLLSSAALPPVLPKIPAWAAPDALPQVRLRDRATALPAEATAHLVTALSIADPDLPGMADVRAALDPGSLAEFAWALFEAWQAHGARPKDDWALRGLGLAGDDETVRRLVPVVHEWSKKKLHDRSVKGLDVLVAVGTPVALLHLHETRRKGKQPAIREEARNRFREAAKRASLSADRLSERIVPDYGLDADGGMTLDYGPRRFRVGFGDRLEPYVADHAGGMLRDLPEPGAGDDPELAPAARRRFTAMKAEVRTASTYLVERLEKAMARGRTWTPDEFRTHFADHPLVRHIARRLVWTAGGTAFRIAEDRTLADVRDDAFVLPDTAVVRLAHPAGLGGDLDAWARTFADYELDQPFPQLGRPFHVLTGDERAAGRLERFEGLVVDGEKLYAMRRRGWAVTEQPKEDHTGGDLAAALLIRAIPDALDICLTVQRRVVGVAIEYRVSEALIDATDPALTSEAIADVVRLVGSRR
ncbi:DUF4132 domain-containing protein [Actinomadura sp. LOL_016]|uniref:DUF4132 domain-containing protein n=1 Tax=unclassified Actinomadura TaxID=2626254 RepID=UPI003A8053F1